MGVRGIAGCGQGKPPPQRKEGVLQTRYSGVYRANKYWHQIQGQRQLRRNTDNDHLLAEILRDRAPSAWPIWFRSWHRFPPSPTAQPNALPPTLAKMPAEAGLQARASQGRIECVGIKTLLVMLPQHISPTSFRRRKRVYSGKHFANAGVWLPTGAIPVKKMSKITGNSIFWTLFNLYLMIEKDQVLIPKGQEYK